MSPAYLLPGLLLAVLGLPLIAAVISGLAGRYHGADVARRTAAWLAATHLILTAVFVTFAVGTIDKPGANLESKPFSAFQPAAVPGDPGLGTDAPLGRTNWSLLSLAAPDAKSLTGTAVQFFVGVDGLNLLLVALTSLLVFLAVLVSWESVGERAGGFYCWLFLLQAACLGAFLSFDLLLFYIFFELTLIPAFFLIGSWGVGGGRRDAARRFFLYTLFGSLFTLVGMIGIAVTNPAPLHPVTGERLGAGAVDAIMPKAGAVTFSIPELMENVHVWDEAHSAAVKREAADAVETQRSRRNLATWLFVALLAGFAVKVPIVPFHTWLPAAYAEAPLAVTMILSAVMAKLGTFGILRIVLPLVPEPAVMYGLSYVGTLGAIGIVYAAFCAYAQKDMKLLAAYSSVSHLGFLVLGLFALTPESLTGATLHMVNHGLTAGAMFALLAFLTDRYRTLDVNHYGGLWSRYPHFAFFFIVIALASVGLPGLCNFVSEMLMLAGLFDPRSLSTAGGFSLAAAAAAGVFLSAWYTFTLVRRAFFGPVKEPTPIVEAKDVSPREWATFGLFTAGCLALGLFPQPVIDLVRPDVQRVIAAADAARTRLNPYHRTPAQVRFEEEHRNSPDSLTRTRLSPPTPKAP